jgi:hypothetical protein
MLPVAQVAVLTGYAVSGGAFHNYLGGLRSSGFIAGGGEQLRITEAGLVALGSWDPLPVGSIFILNRRGPETRVIATEIRTMKEWHRRLSSRTGRGDFERIDT